MLAYTNGWTNSRVAGDMIGYESHAKDVTLMQAGGSPENDHMATIILQDIWILTEWLLNIFRCDF